MDDIFVLLTGPSRGYVKNRLICAGVPFVHNYLKHSDDIASYFSASDIYLVTSREEGGPKAILEAMASGVPLICTKVGMAPDVLIDRQNALLIDVEDVSHACVCVDDLVENSELRERLILNGTMTASNFGWQRVANLYYKYLYQDFL